MLTLTGIPHTVFHSALVTTLLPEDTMLETAASPADANAADTERKLTDGFHLVIEALTLNGINTIYGVPGIPITDLGRMAQAAGMRVISFRHEQNAGNAAAIAGFLTKKPGICLTVSAPGFLNGLTALANATTNCFPMILISGSSEREIVDLQQGDYEEMDQLAIAKPLCKAAFRVLPDTHEQSAAAARSYVLPEADVVMLIGARLNWLLSHGKGKTWGGKSGKDWGRQKFIQIDISPQEADSNVRIDAPVVGDIGSCVAAPVSATGASWPQPPADWLNAISE